MKRLGIILGILFLGLGLFISMYAEGLRRWYSGLFFILLGIILLLTTIFRKGDSGG